MANKIVQFKDDSGDLVPVLAVDNGDGTFSLSVDAALEVGSLTIGKVDQGAAGVADWKMTLDSEDVITKDGGPYQNLTRTFTQNDDISTARDITTAPTAGQKIKAMDVWVSVDTECYVTIQMETSGNVLAGAYVPANSTVPFTLRGMLKGDAADKKLQMKSSVAAKGACTAIYYSEA